MTTDRVEMSFSAVAHVVPNSALDSIKTYASEFAQFQLARVAEELKRRGHYSAGEAVALQLEVLQAIERTS